MALDLISHPLARELLTTLRDQDTPSYAFRDALDRLSVFLVLEATKHLPVREVTVRTPVGPAAGAEVLVVPVLVPVLRAGLGMLPAAQRLLPEAPVAFLGLARDEETKTPSRYLAALPEEVSGGHVLLLDPMIATGGSLVEALRAVFDAGAADATVCCVLAAPEGLERLRDTYPDTTVIAAAVDERLDARAFIVPGLGDAGDRQFGTQRR